MTTLQSLLDSYGESHQNATNKLIHWICVPAIMFCIFGMFYAIPFPGVEVQSLYANWAVFALALALIYYLRLSLVMFLGFVVIGGTMVFIASQLHKALDYSNGMLALGMLGIFAVAWVFQFIGHGIEGKKPSFLKDVQYLLVGPAWLLHFIYDKVGIKY